MMSHNPSKSLTDRVILITGASMGIGRAVAKALAAEGATVILLARNIKRLETLYDEIVSMRSPTPAIYPMNLANASQKEYSDLYESIEQHFGRLDGLIHNAGILGTLSPIEHASVEQWYQVLQVNLNSAFLLTKTTLPLLKRSQDASILFTTADLGKKARAYWGAYAVSKFGCEALMQILADELQSTASIRVNSINPVQARTHLRSSAYPAEDPLKIPTPERLVQLYVHLMGPLSQKITGKSLDITAAELLPA